MIENKFRVHALQWRKWSDASRRLFNDLMETGTDQRIINAHPKTEKLDKDSWHTVVWNLAWLAADYLRDQERDRNGSIVDAINADMMKNPKFRRAVKAKLAEIRAEQKKAA